MDGKARCFRCKNFDRYYVKEVKRFNRTDMGWCCEKCETVKAEFGCEKFALKPNGKKRDMALAVCLSDILAEISELRNIIEEERSGRKEAEQM